MEIINEQGKKVVITCGVIPLCSFIILLFLSRFYPSHIESNQSKAIAALKAYHAAQLLLRSQSDKADFKYTNDYSKLYYGMNNSDPLKLIDKKFADARTFSNGTPYEGYLFEEDGNITDDEWSQHFALIASPYSYAETGMQTYWIGDDGIIYVYHFPFLSECELDCSMNTPLAPLEKRKYDGIWEKY